MDALCEKVWFAAEKTFLIPQAVGTNITLQLCMFA